MVLLVPFTLHKFLPHCNGSIVIFDEYWIKNILTQISSCIKVLNFEKIWRANIYYVKSCSCLDMIMNLNFYGNKLFVNDF